MTKIFRISEAASLGIHTMVLMTSNPTHLFTTSSIASDLAVSEAHLAKVLQRLTKEGFVESVRGPSGGFHLSTNPATTSLMQIYEAIDGPFDNHECLLGTRECRRNSCVFGSMAKSIGDQVKHYLSETTLAQLVEKGDVA
jgi:Rrf2 family protein